MYHYRCKLQCITLIIVDAVKGFQRKRTHFRQKPFISCARKVLLRLYVCVCVCVWYAV